MSAPGSMTLGNEPKFHDPVPDVHPASPSWHVIHAHCQHESRVEECLQQKGLEVFLPRLTVVRQWRDRKKLLRLPLFPGYLFIRDALEGPVYYDIIKLPGVVRILGMNKDLHTVPRETIESIKLTVASDRPYYPHRCLLKGKRVQVVEGPLAGVVGIIREHKAQKRKVVVEVELFRRALAVELKNEAVEPWH
ncbi:MAG: transcription termination/antitermination protein NusG [Desulfobacteraceae bacterium]